MQSQTLQRRLGHAIVALALASVTAACGEIANPVQPSASGGGLSLGAASDLPLKGRLEGAYTLAFPDATTLLVSGEGTGTATHLGRFTFEYEELVDLSTGTGTGTYELTAANGDKLTFVVTDGSQSLITGIGTGHFRFIGGTGRFANATGIISYVVEQNFLTGAYTITAVGSIDY